MSDIILDNNEHGADHSTPILSTGEERNEAIEYWKQRCLAAEEVIKVMNQPRNEPILDNTQFDMYRERYSVWNTLVNQIKTRNQ